MNTKSPGWASTLALIVIGMIAAAMLSVGATLGLGYALWGGGSISQSAPGGGGNVPEDSWASTSSVISPSTVSIQVKAQAGTAEGSGVIYSKDGQILTNAHVVNGAQSITVTLSDGRVLEAEVVGADKSTDLALLQLNSPPKNLTPARFADSSELKVGHDVMAVGTPLGLANTATTGIVSALNRPVITAADKTAAPSDASFTSAIQTDASINPGNSGGPLVNRAGEVIGINSSIASNASSSESAGSIGLGFAIPSNTAKNIADQLAENGSAQHPVLGVRAQDGAVEKGGVGYRGAQLAEVSGGTPAADAGLRNGDVIIKVDDVQVSSPAALTAYIRSLEVGSTHTVTYVRGSGEESVEVTLRAS